MIAIGTYRELKKRLKEAGVKRQEVDLGDGRKVTVREMTRAELRRATAEADTLAYDWPLEQQFVGREAELDALGVSEIRQLSDTVYALTRESLAVVAGNGGAAPEPPAKGA